MERDVMTMVKRAFETGNGHPQTMVELLSHQVERISDKFAYRFLAEGEEETDTLTYGGLFLRAQKIGALLQKKNLQGERALLLYQPGLDYITAFFGCLFAGVIAVPAYPPRNNRNLPRLQAIIEDAQASVALTSENLHEKIQSMFSGETRLQQLSLLATDGNLDEYTSLWRYPQISSDYLAFLQYTSGSTGSPKGVMVSHGNLIHNLSLIYQGFAMNEDSIGIIWLPPYHDMGLIGGLLEIIYAGACTVFMPPAAFLQRPVRMLEAVTRYKGTISGGPNFTYELLVDKTTEEMRSTLDLSSLQIVFNGAEPVRYETLQRFLTTFAPYGLRREALYPCYGLAEGTLYVSGSESHKEIAVASFDKKALERNEMLVSEDPDTSRILVSSGHFFGDQIVKIVNPETRIECPPEGFGEVWVKGASIAKGYWNRPEESRKTFQATLADSGDGPYLRTEDLAFIKDGELFIAGRIKDLIIIRGVNYYPQDIERVVERCHPSLRPGCGAAFSIDVNGEEQLVVAHEVEFRENPDIHQVAAAMQRTIAEEFEVQLYGLVLIKPGHIPKTSSGKIQRYAAKLGYLNNDLEILSTWRIETSPVQDATSASVPTPNLPVSNITQAELERWLVEKISLELHLPSHQIDVNQPFTRYGLDSAKAVLLAGDLQQLLGVSLPATLVYNYPTIAELAKYLVSGDMQPSSPSTAVTAPEGIRGETVQHDDLLTDIQKLSEEEAALLLLQRISEND